MKTLLLGSVLLFVAACGRSQGEPADVAAEFWRAAQTGDIESARAYTVESEGTKLSGESTAQIESFALGETTYENDNALVTTTIEGMQGAPGVVEFSTVLVDYEGEWKVDLAATANHMMKSILGVSIDEMVEQMGQAIAEGMGTAMQGIAEGLGEGMQAMGEAMAEAISEVDHSTRTQPRQDTPYTPTQTGTVDPGMQESAVVAQWGEPDQSAGQGRYTYLFYRNGCEVSCGTHDIVILLDGQVVDAVVRHPGHRYSGVSSSPEGREPVFSPPREASS